MAYTISSSSWACASFLVPKPGPSNFRVTVGLRPDNMFTVKHQFFTADIATELTKLAGSTFFVTFDFRQGYWQLPLDWPSQACQSFETSEESFSTTKALHGMSYAIMFLQSTITPNISFELSSSFLVSLDDLLIHARSISSHMDTIRKLFDFCKTLNRKLHPARCVLIPRCNCWCGRMISSEDFRFDPQSIIGIQSMKRLTTGARLQHLSCALKWMCQAIPDFSIIIRNISKVW